MSEDPGSLQPRPVVDELSAPFWAGVARRELVIERCRVCGYYVHPPFPECTRCREADFEFVAVSGRGRIFERAIVTSPVVVGFEDRVPYACLFVELEEQPQLLVAGILVDGSAVEAVIGRPVEVVFRADEVDGFVLPMFRPTATEAPQ
ncbi:MAG: Zn-ribbon domain-containing OB-fold protein [Acidimicrobiales bacterium]